MRTSRLASARATRASHPHPRAGRSPGDRSCGRSGWSAPRASSCTVSPPAAGSARTALTGDPATNSTPPFDACAGVTTSCTPSARSAIGSRAPTSTPCTASTGTTWRASGTYSCWVTSRPRPSVRTSARSGTDTVTGGSSSSTAPPTGSPASSCDRPTSSSSSPAASRPESRTRCCSARSSRGPSRRRTGCGWTAGTSSGSSPPRRSSTPAAPSPPGLSATSSWTSRGR
mmetsp:Transcript_2958/g.11636  ORF Transcript_2958/g.11636 Transcript_2958/m.11636 type:complete len:229 (-) Transcript_2958:359-1045(-)